MKCCNMSSHVLGTVAAANKRLNEKQCQPKIITFIFELYILYYDNVLIYKTYFVLIFKLFVSYFFPLIFEFLILIRR